MSDEILQPLARIYSRLGERKKHRVGPAAIAGSN
jgi:hypothetical protein